jgi:predicted RNase H-like HicB family nuclease
MAMKFKVILTYDKEYGGYIVDVPELVGCMSQGKTFDEALENIKDAIRGWIKVEKEHGRYNQDEKHEDTEIFLGEVLV